MTTYQVSSPLAMCACAISGSLSILLLVEPSFHEGLTLRLIVPVAVSIGLVSMAIITGVLAHGHGLLMPSGFALALVSVGLSGAIVWEQSGRRAQTRVTTAISSQDAVTERARLIRIRAQSEEALASCPKGRERDQGVKCGLRDAHAAECRGGGGKNCKGIERSIAVNEATVRDYTLQLKGAPTPTPDAKVETIGAAAELAGYDAKTARAWVSLIDPLLVPLLLELAAILCGVVAFGPKASTISPPVAHSTPFVHDDISDFSSRPVGKVLELPRKTQAIPEKSDTRPPIIAANDEDTIIIGLKRLGGKASSQRELARVMGICDSEVSKRLASCTRVERVREDNRVVVRIKV